MAGLAPAPASSSEELVDVVQAVESAPDMDELPLPLFGGVRRGHPPELHEGRAAATRTRQPTPELVRTLGGSRPRTLSGELAGDSGM